ncbi:hypothetical protein DEU56DRAFT_898666 [Suillus clintonianus]|uniref:uncharacterized protein n=1 Tax=Suillus clintonianus TaxID=1904413 RepID=UPI001B885662|nr:uncharacterized protein DEU56DRAFT_898666 [Suillus clintonianus]KAG2150770.1 hypothetical protein DEU56DRAFT_898666 [Suillus clintonianus]
MTKAHAAEGIGTSTCEDEDARYEKGAAEIAQKREAWHGIVVTGLEFSASCSGVVLEISVVALWTWDINPEGVCNVSIEMCKARYHLRRMSECETRQYNNDGTAADKTRAKTKFVCSVLSYRSIVQSFNQAILQNQNGKVSFKFMEKLRASFDEQKDSVANSTPAISVTAGTSSSSNNTTDPQLRGRDAQRPTWVPKSLTDLNPIMYEYDGHSKLVKAAKAIAIVSLPTALVTTVHNDRHDDPRAEADSQKVRIR